VQPHVGAAYCARAQIRLQRGKTDTALKDLARALELDPRNCGGHALRGTVHSERMDYADAMRTSEGHRARSLAEGALQAEIDKIKSWMG
jgi:Tfp pilus assembly protein PilF